MMFKLWLLSLVMAVLVGMFIEANNHLANGWKHTIEKMINVFKK